MGLVSYANELEFSVVNIQFLIQFFLTVTILSFILLSIGYYLYVEKMPLVLFMLAYSFVLMINQFAYSIFQITTSNSKLDFWLHIIYISKTTSVLILIITSLVILRHLTLILSLINFTFFIISIVLLFLNDWPRLVVIGYTSFSLIYLLCIILYFSKKKIINNPFWTKLIVLYSLYFIFDEIIYYIYKTTVSLDWIVITSVILVLVVLFLRRYKLILQEKTDLYDKLITDELTGNYSKAYFNELLEDKYTGYLMMIDINKFKSVNDKFGHIFGDSLLANLGNLLQGYQVNGVIASRVGGDEFMIYTPNIVKQSIIELGEKLINDFNEIIKLNQLQNIDGLGLSLGITKVDSSSKLLILENADSNMYLAKNSGNNKISVNNKIK